MVSASLRCVGVRAAYSSGKFLKVDLALVIFHLVLGQFPTATQVPHPDVSYLRAYITLRRTVCPDNLFGLFFRCFTLFLPVLQPHTDAVPQCRCRALLHTLHWHSIATQHCQAKQWWTQCLMFSWYFRLCGRLCRLDKQQRCPKALKTFGLFILVSQPPPSWEHVRWSELCQQVHTNDRVFIIIGLTSTAGSYSQQLLMVLFLRS